MIEQWEAVWSYAVEVIVASLFCVICSMCFGHATVIAVVLERKQDFMTLTGSALAVIGVVFAAYFALLSTDFGKALRNRGVAVGYAKAFAFPLMLFFATGLTLAILSKNSAPLLLNCATFLLAYSLVNAITMIENVLGLVRVWQDAERARSTGRV